MKVIYSDAALETKPTKEVIHKKWMDGRCYSKRVNKKWLKRYGAARLPCLYMSKDGLMCHPLLKNELINHFKIPYPTGRKNFELDNLHKYSNFEFSKNLRALDCFSFRWYFNSDRGNNPAFVSNFDT
jgi:hypothetical protein